MTDPAIILGTLRRLIDLADRPSPGPLIAFSYVSRWGVVRLYLIHHGRIRLHAGQPTLEGESGLYARISDCGGPFETFAIDRIILEPESP